MKNKQKIIVSLLSISLIVLTGCMFLHQQKTYPFPTDEITVAENTIYCAGKPFAKLMTLHPGDTTIPSSVFPGLGLVIYYFDKNKEVWIYPKNKITLHQGDKEYSTIEDLQREWTKNRPTIRVGGRIMDKEDFVRSGVFDVKISNDGKYIYYISQGMLWNSSHKYNVEYGN